MPVHRPELRTSGFMADKAARHGRPQHLMGPCYVRIVSTEPPFNKGDLVRRSADGPPLIVADCRPADNGWEVDVEYKQGGERRERTFADRDLFRIV